MPFDLGSTVRLTAECRDPGGTLTTAASAVLTIGLPDGTTATPAVPAPVSAGLYVVDYATVQPGRHTVRWVFTGPAHAYTDSFNVAAAESLGLLSLADAKRHLNLTASADDEEVRAWIEATTEVVEWFVGPVVPRTVVEDHAGVSPRLLVLRQVPVLELTSISGILSGSSGYEVAMLSLDGGSGTVTRLDGSRFSGPLRITYEAGRRIVPPVISAAARIILQHMWRTQRGALRGPAIAGGDDYSVTEPIPGMGYAVPNRALELLQPYRLPPGVA